ncbi:hypothetical protein [Amycolatopsis sp. NPDC054798]
MRGVANSVPGETLHTDVASLWWEHRVLPTQMRERLCQDPIRGF